ncbi:MAG: hypothetical protein M1837_001501 [Sclerophora amabilis]|nr:MAG: hypothetical protein M1837_001501 [Sclerophora amabilis]
MSGVFAKEPPLVAKQQLEQPTSQQASMPPPVPPLPPELDKPSSERYDAPSKTAAHLGSPPPPPPKPYGHPTERSQSQIYTPHNGGEHRAAGPPPLPQKPTDHKGGSEAISSPRMYKPSDQSNFHAEKYPPQSPTNHSGNVSLSQPHPSLSHLHASPNASEPFGPVSAIASGAQMEAMYPGRQHAFHQQQVSHHGRPLSQSQFQSVLPPGYASHMPSQQASYGQSSLPPPNQPDPNQYLSHSPHHQPPQQWPPALMPGNMTAPSPPKSRPAPPAEDILSLPTLPSDSLPAPPIPPNPEKDSLLRTFSQSLHAQREEAASRNASTLPSLRAQHSALLNSTSALQQELRALETLEGQLTSNERILAECTRAADKVMAETRDRQPPGVDEVLVAPTVVGGQLYEVVAEQRALSDALVALQRALDRSRVSAEVFAKQTRTLARERFLKLALERKIAQGMGLMLER